MSGPPDGVARSGRRAAAARSAEPERPRALALVGATATGKTEVAIEVARALDGEVISMDSRQAYRGMEIGTAAPTAAERAAAPHHGVGFLEPGERYGAGRFARLARIWVEEIRARGRVPILAGGTGFFLRALTHPVFREPPVDEERRRALRAWLDEAPDAGLAEWVERLDPGLERRLARVDRQRAARSLELALLTGRPLTWWHDHGEPEARPLPVRVYVLWLPREAHRERIAARAAALLARGWPEEARRLDEAGAAGGYGWDAIGYGEALAVARGRRSAEEAVEAITRATWAYARRQRTWFRHQLPADAVGLDARRESRQLARRIATEWKAASGTGGA